MLKISIITINYNNDSELKKTIESVVNQKYQNIEYIIIDGNSKDKSVSIIKEYDSQIYYWVSEPDSGIYQAMNKGIDKSTGDYLLFLNSGDTLFLNNTINKVVAQIKDNYDIYYGNLFFKSKDISFIREYPDRLNFSYFYEDRSLPHPGTFIKRNLFDKIFYYNENLKLVSDWEFFICAICKYGASYKHIDFVISNFMLDGLSNNTENNQLVKEERKYVMEHFFPFLIEDMDNLITFKKLNTSSRVKLIVALEKSKLAQKLNSFWLRLLLKVFRNKSLKDF